MTKKEYEKISFSIHHFMSAKSDGWEKGMDILYELRKSYQQKTKLKQLKQKSDAYIKVNC